MATRLRQLRHHAQLLPDQVAAAAGLPADLYARLEAGEADPGDLQVIQVQALAAAPAWTYGNSSSTTTQDHPSPPPDHSGQTTDPGSAPLNASPTTSR